jgi:hypothetical protein
MYVWLGVALIALLALAACGSGGDNSDASQPSGTLPAPQVRVETLPSSTPEPVVPAATEAVVAPTTVPPTVEVQAWPTLDEEQYLVDQIEKGFDDINSRLNGTNTDIRP